MNVAIKEDNVELIKRIAAYEETLDFSQPGADLGWSWRDVRIDPMVLKRLFLEGFLESPFKSNSYTGYMLSDRGKAVIESDVEELELEEMILPPDLFDVIEGYTEIKSLFRKSLQGEPIDWLMVGPPGSAKTMFLSELERVGGSTPIILGGAASKVGIIDVLFDCQPKLLLLDEFEHIDSRDYTVLLALCESRVVSETKHGKRRRLELPDTRVFAGCNSNRTIPSAVLDRMQVIHFKAYSSDEFVRVVRNVLVKRRGMSSDLSEHIAMRTWEFNSSVRQAIRVSKMVGSREEADRLFDVLSKY